MINKEFIAETDKIIEKIRLRGVKLENGNMLVAKVKNDRVTKGGLYLSDASVEKEDFKSGYARVLALPENTDESSPRLRVGDYVLHSHEARYMPYPSAIRDVLDHLVEEKTIYAVQDNEVILSVSAEVLHSNV